MATKSPFLSAFIASILIVLVLCGLTAILIFLWRYFDRRPKPKSPNNTIPLTTLEDGLTRPTVPRFPFRGPSRLGGNSPSSAKRADGASEAQLQFFAQPRTNNGTQGDGQRLVSGVSQSSAHIVDPMAAERGDWVEGNTKRAKDTSNLTSSDNESGMTSEGDRPQSFVSSYPPRVPPLPPIPHPQQERGLIDSPCPRCGAKRACGHERRSRMFPFLLLRTWLSRGGSGSHRWDLTRSIDSLRSLSRVVWDSRTLMKIFDRIFCALERCEIELPYKMWFQAVFVPLNP
ncbi:hypothetical protein BC826DRAFT_322964 [Russula brevipes]|nr:hypothetical protein BC826DRAFT_322964 [Russula brevipes]